MYRAFMHGDVEGHNLASVQSLSPKERHQKAMAVARQVTRITQTVASDMDKAAIQKLTISKFFIKFWNDLRNVLNNQLAQGRKIRWKTEETYENLKNGNFRGAKNSLFGAAGALMSMVLVSVLGRL